MFDFHGKTVVITGGASGLGRAIGQKFVESGAQLVILDRCEALPQDFYKGAAGFYRVDVTKSGGVEAVAEEIYQEFGKVDVLINCAGITRRMPAETFNEEDFDAVIDVNLKGTFLCCREFGKRMLDTGSGAIINFASLGAHVAITNSAAYCASKGGVAQITKTLAVEWAERGVRVNALTPGVFETPLLKQCVDQDEEYGNRMRAKIPMNRFGRPEELAGPAMFLASDYASYITGHILAVDAGYLAQ